MKKNFLITTGGSGGHVIPATIIYKHLSNEANVLISVTLFFVTKHMLTIFPTTLSIKL